VKVVLFCGGLGMRLRDYSDTIPKPMVNIGYRPILWHVMKYYAHFGHKDFILCLGYKADAIKSYFRNYDESVSNDFVLSAGNEVTLLNSDIHDWNITFIDTGISATIGGRLKAVQPYLEGEDVFLANYSDGLSDLDLSSYIEDALATGKTGSFLCVRPNLTLHAVSVRDGGIVTQIAPITESDVWVNTGFFVFRQGIFDLIHEGDELVVQPFHRLIEREQLYAYRYTGFFTAMDTFKDKERLDEMYARGEAPWEVWRGDPIPPREG
jgi:glucose-1-phosphate cytidylyltransferase